MMSSEEETEALGMHEKSAAAAAAAAALNKQPKPKRTRQRVDAGEPRNSYASIPNFSSRPPAQPGGLVPATGGTGVCGSAVTGSAVPLYQQNGVSMPTSTNGGGGKVLADVILGSRTGKQQQQALSSNEPSQPGADMLLDLGSSGPDQGGPRMNGTAGDVSLLTSRGQSPITSSTTSFLNGNEVDFSPLYSAASGDSNAHLLRDILSQGSRKLSPPVKSPPHQTTTTSYHHPHLTSSSSSSSTAAATTAPSSSGGRPTSGGHALQTPPDSVEHCAAASAETEDSSKGSSGRMSDREQQSSVGRSLLSASPSPCTTPTGTAACSPSASPKPVRPAQPTVTTSLQEVKRARVETIVSNMMHGPGSGGTRSPAAQPASSEAPAPVNGCKKRKLYQPQQHEASRANGLQPDEDEDDMEEDMEDDDLLEDALAGAEDDEEDTSLMMDDEAGQAAASIDVPAAAASSSGAIGDDEECEVASGPPAPKQRRLERDNLRKQLAQMQAQLMSMQQRYWELYEGDSSRPDTPREAASPGSDDARASSVVAMETRRPVRMSPECSGHDTEGDEAPEKVETPVSQSSESGAPRDAGSVGPPHSRSTPSPKEQPALLGLPRGGDPSPHHQHHVSAGNPFADESRRLAAEGTTNDRMCPSRDLEARCRPPEHRQSCIVRPNGHSASATGPTAADLEWFIDSLKRDVQTTLFQIIDANVDRYLQLRASKATTAPPLDVCSSNVNSANVSNANTPSSRELTVLSQMLHDRKSPRTKVIDRGGGGGGGGRLNGHGPLGPRSSPFSDPVATTSMPKNSTIFYPPPFKPTSGHLFCGPPAPQTLPPASSIAQHFGPPPTSQMGPMGTSSGLNGPDVPEQTEAMSLVVAPKKKRHKVTDTRITPRTVSRVLGQDQEGSPKYPLLGLTPSEQGPSPAYPHHPPPPPLVPVSLPTSVAIPNPSLNHSDVFTGFNYDHPRLGSTHFMADPQDDDSLLHGSNQSSFHPTLLGAHGSPDSMHHFSHFKQENGDGSDTGDPPGYDSGLAVTSTLTPMHLRKAKLMFFYVRYPSSSILKMYFPDIKFNKNNTAQLVKWFSNFREFYYIQMEKYARQALSEGVKNPEDLRVSADSELLRVLNLHYNRNNHIEVPENFRYVVENTLREFFKAIVAGKDQEQSWKKAIYKVIARLDDNVPEYFKSPNFLEQLE